MQIRRKLKEIIFKKPNFYHCTLAALPNMVKNYKFYDVGLDTSAI